MSRMLAVTVLGLVLALGFSMILPGRGVAQEEASEVFVTNLPEVQEVQGAVSVEGIVDHGALASLRDLEVPPVGREDVRRLVPAGVLETGGFSAAVLSLTGQAKGDFRQPGEVGAILVPDEEPIARALEEKGLFQFPLEVTAAAAVGDPLFHSGQPRHVIGFPRYRVFLFNTTDKTVTVDLYAYLTN